MSLLGRNKHGGSLSVLQQRGSTLHGPSVTIASQVQTRIENKARSGVLFRLIADDRCGIADARTRIDSGHTAEGLNQVILANSCLWVVL